MTLQLKYISMVTMEQEVCQPMEQLKILPHSIKIPTSDYAFKVITVTLQTMKMSVEMVEKSSAPSALICLTMELQN